MAGKSIRTFGVSAVLRLEVTKYFKESRRSPAVPPVLGD